MAKRDELLLHQEGKLRNKLVEYLTDWVLPSAEHHQAEGIPAELSALSKLVAFLSSQFPIDNLLRLLFIFIMILSHFSRHTVATGMSVLHREMPTYEKLKNGLLVFVWDHSPVSIFP